MSTYSALKGGSRYNNRYENRSDNYGSVGYQDYGHSYDNRGPIA